MVETCWVIKLGEVAYPAAWELQARLAGEIAVGERAPTLLLLQHPHTYTFGRRGKIENLLWDETELARRGVAVHWVDRGGDVTYHGPGQLVGYPLLPLGRGTTLVADGTARIPQTDYVGYVRNIERTLISALERLGVVSGQVEGKTGVWVRPYQPPFPPDNAGRPAKIAAIGVKVDASGVTRHGFALNVHPDMTYWQGIIACGLVDYPVASLAEFLQPPPAMPAVMDAVTAAFGKVFGYAMQETSLPPPTGESHAP